MKQRLWFLTGLLVSAGTSFLFAQPLPQYTPQQRAQQRELLKTVAQAQAANYEQAVTVARRLNRPIEQFHPNGRVVRLRGISLRGELLYDATYSATQQGVTTRTNSLYAGGSLGVSLSGSTLRDRLGIWDGGKVRNTHVEFRNGTGSRVTQVDNAGTLSEHSTHVAGTLIAAGVNPLVRGMAYATNLRAYDFNSQVTEMTSASPNLLVSNHSYGAQAGWVFDDTRSGTIQWEWWGDTTLSQREDYKFGQYDDVARSYDQIAATAPNYLIVKSAGNSHGQNGPAAGQPYYFANSNITSTVPRNDQNGYDQVSTYGTAKNILSVGAAEYLAYGYNQSADISLGDFSSWGPTDDGRIKPDILGVGVDVFSTTSTNDSAYATLDGTSMSSPNVAGSILLLQELFSQRNNGKFMRSSTLRGLVLHTADEAGNAPGPDYRNGWGLLNIERAGRVLLNTDQNYLLDERSVAQGATYSVPVVASGRGPLVVSICWTDPAGTVSSTLNDRTPKLVNDLDVRVSDGTTTTQPWILDPANPANPATRGDNIRDNIEQVLIASPVPGKSYTITVTHKGTLSGNQQDYALIASGIGGKAYCASAATATADTKISRVEFGSINQAGASGCTTYTDFSSVSTPIQANQQLPLTVSLGTCGAARNAIVKVFADWNQNGSFDEAGETIATSGSLTNSAQFQTTVSIPLTVQNGQAIRFRVVASETTDPNAVSACGGYANGETQDYVLNVVQTSNDVGALALVSPENNACSQTADPVRVTVQVRNFGAARQQNVPVSVNIVDAANTVVASLSGTVASLDPFSNRTLTLTAPANLLLAAGQTYRYVVTTALGNDQIVANNQLTQTRTVAPAATGGLFTAATCGSDTAISLNNAGAATAFWYDAPTGGNLLAAGNRTSFNRPPANGVYYATLNEFSGRVGPAAKTEFGGGSYAFNFGPRPLISTTVPVVLSSARLYIAHSGQIALAVAKLDGTVLSSVTLDVTATRTLPLSATASNGQLADDPNDPGAVYPLNLSIPQAGEYQILIAYGDSAAIYRSNVGVSGFPYRLRAANGQTIVSSRGSLFNNATTGKVDTLTSAWYYFYDLQVRSLGCTAAQRQAVRVTAGTATTATIAANGSTTACQGSSVTLQANTSANLTYQWLRGGQPISGATNPTYQATISGNYAVRVSGTCLPATSSAVPVAINSPLTPIITTNGFTLTTNAVSNVQWLRDGVAVPGATTNSFTVVQSGRYSVRGSVNGCGEAVSDEVFLSILANEPEPEDNVLSVFPNPATRQLTVTVTATAATKAVPTVQLKDLRGLTVRTATLQRSGKAYSTVLDVADLPGGTFFVVVADEPTQTIRVKRIRKQ